MVDVMHSLVVVIWMIGSLIALVAGVSLLLFLVGLGRFIRYERRLAANWNKLRGMRGKAAPSRPRPMLACRSGLMRDRALRSQR